jgi:uncharacterized protein with HEPN domain
VSARRSDDDLLADIVEAAGVGAQIVERGREAFDADPVIRFAAEAVVGRIGDAASKLGTEVKEATGNVPWREVVGMRIVVDHAYHRIDHDRLWNTLANDLRTLREAIEGFRHP